MAPGADLIAEKMLGSADHALAQEERVRIQRARCQIMEFLRGLQRSAVSTARVVAEMQAVKRAQLVLRVAKACRDLELLRERSAHLGRLGRRVAERVVRSHLLPRVTGPATS